MLLPVLICGLVGLLFLGLGLYVHSRSQSRLSLFTETAEGVVVDFTEPSYEGNVRPRVQFNYGDRMVTIVGKIASSPPAYDIGQKVSLRFPHDNPATAVIADFWNLYLFQIVLLCFGAIALVVSVGLATTL